MANKQYTKGRRREHYICDKLKKQGYDIVQRSAGSHSPFDIIAINKESKEIKLIQVKPESIQQSNVNKIMNDNALLNGVYSVKFLVL